MKHYKQQKLTLLFTSLFLFILFGCEKQVKQEKGYTLIKTITNTLPVSVDVKLAWWIRNNIKIDSLKYKSSVNLKPGESWRTDSAFICEKNCDAVFGERDPYTGIPILIKFVIDNKVKVDTNCINGLISAFPERYNACNLDKKNYFNAKHHIRTEIAAKNIVRDDYQIDIIDINEAK